MAAPVVTGISPKRGDPGTQVIIRGENLGTGQNDIFSLTICGTDCLYGAEWVSSTKIKTIAMLCKGEGDIIVTTLSGGKGTSTVKFQGTFETIEPHREVPIWVDETHATSTFWNRMRPLSPAVYQPEDPLNLSVEESVKKYPTEELHKLFSEGSSNIRSQNFVAEWYLLENYHSTPMKDLKAGLKFLSRKVESQKVGQLSFLKSNVGCVLTQLDTLVALKEAIEENKKKFGNHTTEKVEEAITASQVEANKLFEGVLARKDQADAKRSALTVLQRYKFLFSLPTNIEKNIQKGDYDAVINDYARAKSLLENLEMQIFQNIYTQVEQRINGLRNILGNKLQEMPSSLEEQKKIIRNLANLETPGDKAWDCISCQYNYINRLLVTCFQEHMTADTDAENIEKLHNKSAMNTPLIKTMASTQHQSEWQVGAPQRVLFVEEEAELLAENFPDLWKLGQAYFTGELQSKVDYSKQPEFKHMIISVAQLFASVVRAAIVPHALDHRMMKHHKLEEWPGKCPEIVLASWMTQCLRFVRTAYVAMINMDLPGEVLDIVQELIFDIRKHALAVLFRKAANDIATYHEKETWKIEFDEDNGGITELPGIFENSVHDTIQLVKEAVLKSERRENDLLENSSVKSDLILLIQKLFTNFTTALDALMKMDGSNKQHLIVSPVAYSTMINDKGRMDTGEFIPQRGTRLLLLLSNCRYMTKCVLPHLKEVFKKLAYPDVTGPLLTANKNLASLDKKGFDAYTELKLEPLVGMLETSMYIGNFDWSVCPKPSSVSNYIKKTLMGIIDVHAEISAVSSVFLYRLMTKTVEVVTEEMLRLLSCVPQFSQWGALQAHTDLTAFQEAVKMYMTPNARKLLKDSLALIPPLDDSAHKKMQEDLINKFKTGMRFQLMCFETLETSVKKTW